MGLKDAAMIALRCGRALLRGAGAALLALFAVTSLLWGAWLGAAACGVALEGMRRRRRRILGGGLLLIAMGAPFTIATADAEFSRLDRKVASAGPGALSRLELTQIWFGNLSMSAVACALSWCEAAAESAALAAPVDLGRRSVDSAFPWRASPWLRESMRAHARAVAGAGGRRLPAEGLRLVWRGARYDMLAEGAAIMALGGGRLKAGEARRAGRGWTIPIRAEIPIRYKKGAFTSVFDAGAVKLTLRDGVFWAAQERGWLRPWHLSYRFALRVDRAGAVQEVCPGDCAELDKAE